MSGVTSYEELSFQVIRADDKVISVVWGNEGYNQGAHGWYIQDYRNYYTQTGEKLPLTVSETASVTKHWNW